ncbi:hypothetical protein J6590_052202 [Homalodisca vitripennis]|nr:hypothetical protein J6590_052202 [Homalodisca vitripennis]
MGRAVKGASVNQVYTRQSITAVDDSDLDNRWSPKTGAVSVFRASTYNWATRGRLSTVQTESVGEFVRSPFVFVGRSYQPPPDIFVVSTMSNILTSK